MEDGDLAAYVEQMAKELDTHFERHDLDSVLDSPLVLTRPDQWLFYSWPLSQESRQILSDMRLGYYLLYDGSDGYDQELIDHLDSDSSLLSPIDFTRDHRFHIPLLRSDISPKGTDEELSLIHI